MPELPADALLILVIAALAWLSPRLVEGSMLTYAALLSLVACIIHATVLPEHLAEMWQHGLFMLAAVVGQGLGVLLLPSGRRWVLWATLAGNALIVAIAIWAYGWGLPGWLYGDGREALNWQVVACTVAEAALCALCMTLLAQPPPRRVRLVD